MGYPAKIKSQLTTTTTTLNSQIHGSTTTDNACGCSMLCNQIQGEHIFILRTDINILSYFSNSWGI
jgi:hypothetical protein